MLKKTLEWTIPLVLAGIMTGCATYRPPAQIQSAVATVNRHTPEYVTEANKALREVGHPDAERLTGVVCACRPPWTPLTSGPTARTRRQANERDPSGKQRCRPPGR